MAQLFRIHQSDAPDAPNVVFIHGLGGHPRETWMHNSNDHTTLWPSWIGEDADCNVWVLGYDAATSAWKGPAMHLADQGVTLMATLLYEKEMLDRPLVLVGHSLGGLVIKSGIVDAETLGDSRFKPLLETIACVVFVGTPHQGAALATVAAAGAGLLRTNPQVINMASDDAWLKKLNGQFRVLQEKQGFQVAVFFETHGYFVGRKFFGISFGTRITIVDRNSSDPQIPGVVPTPIDGDHLQIAKPLNRGAMIHKGLASIISTCRSKEEPVSGEKINASVDAAYEVGGTDVFGKFEGHIASSNNDRLSYSTFREVEAASVPPITTTVSGPRVVTPDRFEAIPAEERADEVVHLAFATHGYVGTGASEVPICGSLCITTDDPERLRKAVEHVRTAVAADPLVPSATKALLAKASLRTIIETPIARITALRQLSMTSFSAYLYYCPKRDFDEMQLEKRAEALLVMPLFHRLRIRNQHIARVNSQVPEIVTLLANARRQVVKAYKREPALPMEGADKFAPLEELASFVVSAACNYLSNSQDASVVELFENLRTRIRYAENVCTGEKHLRDANPLP